MKYYAIIVFMGIISFFFKNDKSSKVESEGLSTNIGREWE